MAHGREGLSGALPRPERDHLRGRQRLPGFPGRARRGSTRLPSRHLRQRLPRDLAHRLRRAGPRLRQDRPDHAPHHRGQDPPPLRGRRAAVPAHRGPARLRARARHARGHPRSHGALGDTGRQAGTGLLPSAGFLRAPSPGRHLLRGDRAERDGTGGDLVGAHRQPRARGCDRARRRPATLAALRPPRAAGLREPHRGQARPARPHDRAQPHDPRLRRRARRVWCSASTPGPESRSA